MSVFIALEAWRRRGLQTLAVAEKREDAAAVLRSAAALPDSHPRDRELRPEAVRLLESLESGKE